MENDLLRTKLQIPPLRTTLVPRPRLMAMLDEALPEEDTWQRKLTLLSAPAGYGKTTLLSAWSRRMAHPSAWFSVDRDDNEPFRFLSYLVAAQQVVSPQIGLGVVERLRSAAGSLQPLLISLLNDVALLAPPFALVLDDYHLVEDSRIHDMVAYLLKRQPQQMHLIIATRADPPLPLPRLRGEGLLTEVRADQLRFTPLEATTFLEETMGFHLSSSEAEPLVARLEQKTEGWIAGLQMAALALRGRGGEETAALVDSFGGTHRYVLDYLMEEVLQQQPATIQNFLLQTSILDRFCAELCDALCQGEARESRPDSLQLLDYLESHNLFLVPLDEQRRWYRYHHLFATLLRLRLESSQPKRVAELHGRASRWLAAAGFMGEAIAHALDAGDVERAALLVEQNAFRMVSAGQLGALAHWIQALPPAVVAERPWLSVFAAWSRYWAGARDEVEGHLHTVEALLAERGGAEQEEEQELVAHVALLRAHQAIQDEDVATIATMARRASDLLPAEGSGAGFFAWLSRLTLGMASWGLGDVAGAERGFAAARRLALQSTGSLDAVVPGCYQSLQLIRQGRIYEAEALLLEVLDSEPAWGREKSPVAGFAYLRLGDIVREWNDLDEAERFLCEGLALCKEWGLADAIVDSYAMLARLHFSGGEVAAMARVLATAGDLRQRAQIDPFVCTWLDNCQLRLWIYEGDFDAVRGWVAQCGLGVDGPVHFLRDLDHTNLALALVALARQEANDGMLQEAERLVSRLLHVTQAAGWVDEQLQLRLLQVLLLEVAGERSEALAALAAALTLAEPGGYVRRFLDAGLLATEENPLLPLLYQLLERPETAAYSGRLLQQARGKGMLLPPPGTTEPAALLEPLTERERDVLRLMAAGLSNQEGRDPRRRYGM